MPFETGFDIGLKTDRLVRDIQKIDEQLKKLEGRFRQTGQVIDRTLALTRARRVQPLGPLTAALRKIPALAETVVASLMRINNASMARLVASLNQVTTASEKVRGAAGLAAGAISRTGGASRVGAGGGVQATNQALVQGERNAAAFQKRIIGIRDSLNAIRPGESLRGVERAFSKATAELDRLRASGTLAAPTFTRIATETQRLGRELDAAAQKYRTFQEAGRKTRDLVTESNRVSRALEKMTTQLAAATARLREQRAGTQAFANTQARIAALNSEIAALLGRANQLAPELRRIGEAGLQAFGRINQAIARGNPALAKMRQEIAGVNGQLVRAQVNARRMDEANRAFARAQAAAARFRGGLSSILLVLRRLIARALRFIAIAAGISGALVLREAFVTLRDFEKAMDSVLAVTGATTQQFKDLQRTARDLGATTVFTAVQAAQGMKLLGQAGFEANEIIAAIPGTLDLAIAGNVDLATSANIVAGAVRGFALRADEASRVADILATTATSTNVTIVDLGEALKFVAPVAQAAGVSIEEISAALGVLGNAGIKGTLGGTALRRVIQSLLDVTPKAEKALKSAGLTIESLNPRSQELADILTKLSESGVTLGQVFQIFDLRGAPAVIALTSANARLRQLQVELENSEGAAARLARVMRDNLAGDIRIAISAFQEAVIAAGESGLLKVLRDIAQEAAGVIRNLAGVGDPLDEIQVNARDTTTTIERLISIARGIGRIFRIATPAGQAATAIAEMNAALDEYNEKGTTGNFISDLLAAAWNKLAAAAEKAAIAIGLFEKVDVISLALDQLEAKLGEATVAAELLAQVPIELQVENLPRFLNQIDSLNERVRNLQRELAREFGIEFRVAPSGQFEFIETRGLSDEERERVNALIARLRVLEDQFIKLGIAASVFTGEVDSFQQLQARLRGSPFAAESRFLADYADQVSKVKDLLIDLVEAQEDARAKFEETLTGTPQREAFIRQTLVEAELDPRQLQEATAGFQKARDDLIKKVKEQLELIELVNRTPQATEQEVFKVLANVGALGQQVGTLLDRTIRLEIGEIEIPTSVKTGPALAALELYRRELAKVERAAFDAAFPEFDPVDRFRAQERRSAGPFPFQQPGQPSGQQALVGGGFSFAQIQPTPRAREFLSERPEDAARITRLAEQSAAALVSSATSLGRPVRITQELREDLQLATGDVNQLLVLLGQESEAKVLTDLQAQTRRAAGETFDMIQAFEDASTLVQASDTPFQIYVKNLEEIRRGAVAFVGVTGDMNQALARFDEAAEDLQQTVSAGVIQEQIRDIQSELSELVAVERLRDLRQELELLRVPPGFIRGLKDVAIQLTDTAEIMERLGTDVAATFRDGMVEAIQDIANTGKTLPDTFEEIGDQIGEALLDRLVIGPAIDRIAGLAQAGISSVFGPGGVLDPGQQADIVRGEPGREPGLFGGGGILGQIGDAIRSISGQLGIPGIPGEEELTREQRETTEKAAELARIARDSIGIEGETLREAILQKGDRAAQLEATVQQLQQSAQLAEANSWLERITRAVEASAGISRPTPEIPTPPPGTPSSRVPPGTGVLRQTGPTIGEILGPQPVGTGTVLAPAGPSGVEVLGGKMDEATGVSLEQLDEAVRATDAGVSIEGHTGAAVEEARKQTDFLTRIWNGGLKLIDVVSSGTVQTVGTLLQQLGIQRGIEELIRISNIVQFAGTLQDVVDRARAAGSVADTPGGRFLGDLIPDAVKDFFRDLPVIGGLFGGGGPEPIVTTPGLPETAGELRGGIGRGTEIFGDIFGEGRTSPLGGGESLLSRGVGALIGTVLSPITSIAGAITGRGAGEAGGTTTVEQLQTLLISQAASVQVFQAQTLSAFQVTSANFALISGQTQFGFIQNAIISFLNAQQMEALMANVDATIVAFQGSATLMQVEAQVVNVEGGAGGGGGGGFGFAGSLFGLFGRESSSAPAAPAGAFGDFIGTPASFGGAPAGGTSGTGGATSFGLPLFQDGGITKRDTLAGLHANEAVIPLTERGRIPVDLQNQVISLDSGLKIPVDLNMPSFQQGGVLGGLVGGATQQEQPSVKTPRFRGGGVLLPSFQFGGVFERLSDLFAVDLSQFDPEVLERNPIAFRSNFGRLVAPPNVQNFGKIGPLRPLQSIAGGLVSNRGLIPQEEEFPSLLAILANMERTGALQFDQFQKGDMLRSGGAVLALLHPPEAIVPTKNGAIPATMTSRGLVAPLPSGIDVPISLGGLESSSAGAMASGRATTTAASALPSFQGGGLLEFGQTSPAQNVSETSRPDAEAANSPIVVQMTFNGPADGDSLRRSIPQIQRAMAEAMASANRRS